MGKLKLIVSILSILSFILLSSFDHEYFVSITNINLKEETKQLQIEVKLDAEDLEHIILKEMGKEVDLDKIKETDIPIIGKYLSKHLGIWINGGSIKLELIGEELNPDGSFWCYLVADLPSVSQSIKIKNDILLPTFIQQHNIVNLKADGKVQSHTFINKHTTYTFKLDAK
jgi:predicted RNA-binding protein YlqC (UPF0109 family)